MLFCVSMLIVMVQMKWALPSGGVLWHIMQWYFSVDHIDQTRPPIRLCCSCDPIVFAIKHFFFFSFYLYSTIMLAATFHHSNRFHVREKFFHFRNMLKCIILCVGFSWFCSVYCKCICSKAGDIYVNRNCIGNFC